MILRLYERIDYLQTSASPTWIKLGTLRDAMSCIETSSINSEWEMVLEYPINGLHASDLQVMRIIHDGQQNFFIYRIVKNAAANTMTVYARHVNYLLSFVPVHPFKISACTPTQFCNQLSVLVSTPFSISSELTGTQDVNMYDMNVGPSSVRDFMLNDTYGAVGTYGGEWVFDNFSCVLKTRKGSTKNITIRYGVDLIDAKQEESIENLVTHIIPYAYISDQISKSVQLTDITYSQGTENFIDRFYYEPLKTTTKHYELFTHTPHLYIRTNASSSSATGTASLEAYTAGQANLYALPGASSLPFKRYAFVNVLDDSVEPSQLISLNTSTTTYNMGTVTLVQGSQYKNASTDTRTNITYTNTEQRAEKTNMTVHYDIMRSLATKYVNAHPVTFPVDITVQSLPEFMQGVQLGDTITVDYPDYGITTQAEITSMDYDVLKEQIISYTLGKGRTSFAQTMLHQDNKIERLDGLVTAKNPNKGL